MGMYDHIRVIRTMPDGHQSDDWYQTKSMECLLVDYEIDDAGQLWELGVCELPSPNGKTVLTYTGEIDFYTLLDEAPPAPRVLKNYRATFNAGKLLAIRAMPTVVIPHVAVNLVPS